MTPGGTPISAIDRLQACQAQARAQKARGCARAVLAWLQDQGVDAAVIGSLARGDFRVHSDVDFLVRACPVALLYTIEGGVGDRMGGLPFDVFYLDEMAPAARDRVLREGKDASALA